MPADAKAAKADSAAVAAAGGAAAAAEAPSEGAAAPAEVDAPSPGARRVVCFVNGKSGGKQGKAVLKKLRTALDCFEISAGGRGKRLLNGANAPYVAPGSAVADDDDADEDEDEEEDESSSSAAASASSAADDDAEGKAKKGSSSSKSAGAAAAAGGGDSDKPKGGGGDGGAAKKKKKAVPPTPAEVEAADVTTAKEFPRGRVFDLMATSPPGPERGLRWAHKHYGENDFVVLVCGGDGTVGWVLGSMDKMGLWGADGGDADWAFLAEGDDDDDDDDHDSKKTKKKPAKKAAAKGKKGGKKGSAKSGDSSSGSGSDSDSSSSSSRDDDDDGDDGAVREARKPSPPPCAVLPLGTGNDMARALGWGGGYTGGDVGKVLEDVRSNSVPVWVDRWKVECRGLKDDDFKDASLLKKHRKARAEAAREKEGAADGSLPPDSQADSAVEGDDSPLVEYIMCNYLSVGDDAEVALGFHEMREKHSSLFASRVVNKAWYGVFSAKSILKIHGELRKGVRVIADGKELPLDSSLRGLVFLNLPSWAAGVDLWGRSKDIDDFNKKNDTAGSDWPIARQQVDDRRIEVVGLSGFAHMGATQMGIQHGARLAHARSVTMINEAPICAQVDGEPWQLIPCATTIKHHRQSVMLYNPNDIKKLDEELAELVAKGIVGGTEEGPGAAAAARSAAAVAAKADKKKGANSGTGSARGSTDKGTSGGAKDKDSKDKDKGKAADTKGKAATTKSSKGSASSKSAPSKQDDGGSGSGSGSSSSSDAGEAAAAASSSAKSSKKKDKAVIAR